MNQENETSEPRYVDLEMGSINSMGLPNLGYKKYIEFSEILKQKYNKPVFTSVSGMCMGDFPKMVKEFQENSQVDFIEVNLSCPNVIGKPQIAYDFEATENILCLVENLGDKPIGLKLPPYFDPIHTNQVAEIIAKHPKIKFLTCINSVGNTLFINPEKEEVVIKPKGGFGGLGGTYIKPIALANVRAFYKILGNKVKIIGVGGIYSGRYVFEFLLAGASLVQLGTSFVQQGAEVFERINNELINYLKERGYKNAEDSIGKLKEL
ncbi:MAG: dihydroorotate oxidase [Candidatus Gracilibacteria bacterium]|nr:dihydroorotate oxidase [Candidatus Gracilibacteria bacterium]